MSEIPKINTKQTKNNIVKFIQNKVSKANVDGLVIGLSGGIDSTLAAYLACEAVGSDKVFGIIMPSSTTPTESAFQGPRGSLSGLSNLLLSNGIGRKTKESF